MIVELDDSPEVIAMVPTLVRDVDRLSRCLQSVVAQDADLRVAIICIANDGDPTAVLPPMTTLLRPGLNLGWAGGLCFARSVADAGFLWLVQDDMTLEPDCLATLCAVLLADGSLGAAAPVVVDVHGDVRPGSAGGVLARDGELRLVEWLPDGSVPPDQLVGLDRLDYVPSRGTLVRARAWDSVGGLDAQYYPVTWADVDFCTALRATGWQFRIVPAARAHHEQGGSTPGAYGEVLFRRNNRRFARKWGNDLRRPASGPTPHPAVPPALLADIAVAASGVLGELATEFVTADADAVALRAETVTLRAKTEALHVETEALHVELLLTRREIEQMQGSRSWRVTAPLRAVRRWAHRPGSAQPPKEGPLP